MPCETQHTYTWNNQRQFSQESLNFIIAVSIIEMKHHTKYEKELSNNTVKHIKCSS